MNTFGRNSFGFLPRTYIVPEDREELEEVMKASDKAMIVKPPNWYCGIGIKLINKIGIKGWVRWGASKAYYFFF